MLAVPVWAEVGAAADASDTEAFRQALLLDTFGKWQSSFESRGVVRSSLFVCTALPVIFSAGPFLTFRLGFALAAPKISKLFEQLVAQSGSAAARACIKARGSNDWTVWYFDRWLAEREGREPPLEPSLFAALLGGMW